MTLPRTRLVAALIALALIAVILGITIPPVISAYGEGRERLELRQRLHAALLVEAGQLRQPLPSAEAEAASEALLPEGSDSAASAGLQDQLHTLFREAGATASSLEALPAVAARDLRQIGVRVQFAASHEGLVSILHGIEDGRMLLVVSSLAVRARTSRAVGETNPLDVSLEVHGFKPGGER